MLKPIATFVTCALYLAANVTADVIIPPQSLDGAAAAPPPGSIAPAAMAAAIIVVNIGATQVTTVARGGLSERIGLLPSQPIAIAVQYPVDKIGQTITAEALDGGQILGLTNQFVVGPDGAIHFQLQPQSTPGVSQIALRDGGGEIGLQFYVLDLLNPDNNPPTINSSVPSGPTI